MCKRLRCALAIITVYIFNLAFSCSKVANLEYQLTIEPVVNLSDYQWFIYNFGLMMGKRELIALLNLSSWCLVMAERLFLAVPRGWLQSVIVVFPDHTYLLFFMGPGTRCFPYQWVPTAELWVQNTVCNVLMTSLKYFCILGLAEIKTLHPKDKIMRKRCSIYR